MLKVAIIQDQRKTEHSWARICAAMGPNWRIAGEAGSVEEGIKLILDTRPDLVILEPQLPDGSGFAVFEATTELEYRKALLTVGNRHMVKAARYNAKLLQLYMPEAQLAHSLAMLHQEIDTATVHKIYHVQRHPQPESHLDFCIMPDGQGRTGFWMRDLLAVVKEGRQLRVHLHTGESWLCSNRPARMRAAFKGQPIVSDIHHMLIYLTQVQAIDTETQGAYVRFHNGQALAIERAFLPILSHALDHFRQAGAHGNA